MIDAPQEGHCAVSWSVSRVPSEVIVSSRRFTHSQSVADGDPSLATTSISHGATLTPTPGPLPHTTTLSSKTRWTIRRRDAGVVFAFTMELHPRSPSDPNGSVATTILLRALRMSNVFSRALLRLTIIVLMGLMAHLVSQ